MLPSASEQPPGKVWVGHGNGRSCDACEQYITPSDLEYEVDLSDGRALRFHSKCLAAWHQARTDRLSGPQHPSHQ